MRFQTFLEKKGEKAHRDAIAMGLQYKGFGYWADPNTGEAKYKTVNDQLVPVEPDVESDLYKGDTKEKPGMMSGTPQQGGMVQPGADAAQAPAIGTGNNIQGGLGVDANAPQKKGWDAGPDGDTCVGGQPREDVPPDTFVGKTNNKNWQAGPDGSHAMELGEMRQLIERDSDLNDRGDGFDTTQGKEFVRKLKADRKINRMRDGQDVSPVGQITRNKIAGMLSRKELGPDSVDNVGGAIGGAGYKSNDTLGQRVQRKLELAQKFGDAAGGKPAVDRELAAKRQKQRDKDFNVVENLNDTLRTGGFFADPEFDLDDVGESIGEGAFGEVFLGKDGQSVIKDGEIGLEELAVLRKLRDNPMFPTLLKGEITSPFSHTSSVKNNPNDRPSQRRGPGEVAYFDPDEQEDFEDRFPTARGRYAMSLAKGKPFGDVIDELFHGIRDGGVEDEEMHELLDKVFRARRDLHMAGIAHNDMHGGNMLVDDNGALSVIDMGMAEDNPLAALMEGLGGVSGYDGQFFMGAAPAGIANVINNFTSYEQDDRFQENIGNIEQMIMDSVDGDPSNDDEAAEFDNKMELLTRIMKGGIRQPKQTWPMMKRDFPILGNNEKVMEMIKMLYNGFEDAPVQDRMSQAFDRLKDTTDGVLNLKTDRRLRKGEPLVPRRNLDIDD